MHLIRNPLNLASWKDRKTLAAPLKPIYQAAMADAAATALDAFAEGEWGQKFPTVAAMWRDVAQGQVEKLAGRLSAGEVSPVLDDFA